jgi:hypothetical protein
MLCDPCCYRNLRGVFWILPAIAQKASATPGAQKGRPVWHKAASLPAMNDFSLILLYGVGAMPPNRPWSSTLPLPAMPAVK